MEVVPVLPIPEKPSFADPTGGNPMTRCQKLGFCFEQLSKINLHEPIPTRDPVYNREPCRNGFPAVPL